MLLGVADVVGTSLGAPVPGALEMTESTMVLVVFGGLAYAQIRRSHIRVELVYLRAGPMLRSVMDLVAVLSALVFFGLLGWQGFNEALYSWSIAEATSGIIRFPLYPARFLLVFGTFLMLVQLLLDLWDIVNQRQRFSTAVRAGWIATLRRSRMARLRIGVSWMAAIGLLFATLRSIVFRRYSPKPRRAILLSETCCSLLSSGTKRLRASRGASRFPA